MVYIPPDSVFDPGVVLGDAKTIETRGVKIKINAEGYPEEGLKPGVACWIDNSEEVPYARPYPEHSKAVASELHAPFGVVLRVYARDRQRPHQLNQSENIAVVAVSGTVGLKFTALPEALPGLGDCVSPYGGSNAKEPAGFPVLGICDGKCQKGGEDGKQTVIAVRLDLHGEVPVSGTWGTPLIEKCMADEPILKYSWVYASNEQGFAEEKPPLRVKNYGQGGHNKPIYGLAMEGAAAKDQMIDVLYYGIAYVPYSYRHTAIAAGLDTANGGELPKTFSNRIVHSDGSVSDIVTTVLTVGGLIGTAVDIGGGIYRMLKGGSSPAKCVDNITAERDGEKFQQLLAAEDGAFNVAIDGYQGLFVNPGLMAPATLTEAPVLLPDPVPSKNGNAFIAEGYIYAGGDSGVRRITEETKNSTSFYGVSAPKNTEDTAVNPPVNDLDPHIRVIREGVANVVAAENWKQGDYIDYVGKPIPEEAEDFVPHIGKALEATTAGNLGPVDIRWFDPNQYAIVDHCKLSPIGSEVFSTGSTVFITRSSSMGTIQTNVYLAGKTADYLFDGVCGVLVRYDENFYGMGEYDGRAVIQISGYVKCVTLSPIDAAAGMLVQYMKNDTAYLFMSEQQIVGHYANILGTLLKTESVDGTISWWIALAPRTQYVRPSNQKE